MFLIPKIQATNQLLVDTGGADGLRVQRVWRLVTVQLGTWLFFAAFLGIRGFILPSLMCCMQVMLMYVIIKFHQGARSRSFSSIMNMSLVASLFGLMFVSLSDPSMHRTMFFCPVSILIASQLLGVRAAYYWLVVNIWAQVVFHCVAYGLANVWSYHLDELTLSCGAAACLFFCCQQGEAFYEERTRSLTQFSETLKRTSADLQTLATTDSLTGLVNRHQFQLRLEASVAHAVSTNERMALLVFDMDGFKEINDTMGHPVGDQALIEIAKRLSDCFPQPATVARLGGDEFCIILPNVGTIDDAGAQAAKACVALTRRYIFQKCDFPLGTSAGVALCPDDTQDTTNLFAFADTAMFQAKVDRRGYVHYDPSMTRHLIEQRAMQERLSRALEQNEFFLVYQPQVSLRTGKITGVEALLRWKHNGEIISPAFFIPLLEKSREIIPIGRWIIWESCRQLRMWQDQGYDFDLSINVSAVQFNDDDFNASIERAVHEFDLDASKLDFEITESLLVEDVNQAITRLMRIKELGASISIDDFGTGYSSLAYLRQFPLDRLKIDRTFVKDIPDRDDGVIAASIVALGKAIGLRVLAEGVETAEQLEQLKALDCDEYQGYLFSQPLTVDDFESLMNEISATHATV